MNTIKVKSINLQKVLDVAQTTVDGMVKYFIEWFPKKFERQPTEYDIECYRIDVVVNLIIAFGNYIKDTDIVKEIYTRSDAGGVVSFDCRVVRDEVEYYFGTRMIVAGGYNIQCRHYRYIADTQLPCLNAKILDAEALKARKAGLTKSENLKKQIAQIEKNDAQFLDRIKKNMAMTDAEILAQHYLGDDRTWERLNEYAKASYKSKAEWQSEIDQKRIKAISEHRTQYSQKNYDKAKKSQEKDMAKLNAKLAGFLEQAK